MKKILIVGGVAGGASVAARVRRLDENVEIIMFERGAFVSFANCGLPYHIGGEISDRNNLILQTPERFLSRFNVDVRTQQEVIALDKHEKMVTVKNLVTNEVYQETYDKLVLSPGAYPVIPPISGIVNPLTHSLRNLHDMDAILNRIQTHQVKQVTVIGGGFIGLEMVEAFVRLGIRVNLVEMANQVMGSLDPEMAIFAHSELERQGVKLSLGVSLQSVQYCSERTKLTLNLSSNETFETDLLILAIGVKPENTLAQQADLRLGKSGGVLVNSEMKTSDPDIYAVGDVTENIDLVTGESVFVPLAGPANRQGRIAANNLLGKADEYHGTQGTAICKVFDLALASTGKNEKQLQSLGIEYETVFAHAADHASYYPGSEIISLKLLFSSESGRLLGAQAVGKQGVDKRIDVLAVALRANMTVEQLQHLELTYAPPFGSAKDVVNQAAFIASNIRSGFVKPIHFSQIDIDQKDQWLLDVRTPSEFALGHIEGATNIPVDEMRERLHELPLDKEIVVYCQVGLRGHVAYCQLMHHGFSVRNLIGGYKTYSQAMKVL